MKKLTVIALAALLLFSACAPGGEMNINNNQSVKQLSSATAPEAAGYDDYETRMKIRDANEVGQGFIEALNDFSYESVQKMLSEDSGNVCCSPVSLYYALALASTGAEGKTQQEMLSALRMENADELSDQCARLYRTMYTDNEIGKLILANSVWVDKDFAVNGEFLDNAVARFYAETFGVDFTSDDAPKAMKKWIDDYTNGLLEPEFKPDPQQVMSIINTIYFSDEWTDRFSEDMTAEAEFTLADGERIKTDFMNATFWCHSLTDGANYTATSISTKNNRSMVFILPDEGVSVYDLLDAQTLEAILGDEGDVYGEVVFSVPKFDQSSDMSLVETLKAMGVTSAFDAEEADFSGISDQESYISSVIQQCRVKIDEKGVEAAAYTQIDMCGAGIVQGRAELILNRPFIYAIIDGYTGALLFAGVVNDPSK